jgi:hypothetical protein
MTQTLYAHMNKKNMNGLPFSMDTSQFLSPVILGIAQWVNKQSGHGGYAWA